MDIQKIIESLQNAIVALQCLDNTSCIKEMDKAAEELNYVMIYQGKTRKES